ncbi:MAG: LemA family protein [Oscillospiraceae bacterium]
MPALLIVVGIVVVLGAWFISAQRNLVHLDELCGNAMSQIGVQLSSRWDALTALVQLIKSYNEHEYSTLMETVKARSSIGANSSAQEAQSQEDAIGKTLGRLLAISENYPDLKSNQVYLQTMNSLNGYEENVRTSRMVYNDTVTKFNRYVRMIPANIIASMLGFSVRDYLKEDASKADMPNVSVE